MALGAFVSGFPTSNSALDDFNTLVGSPARIVMYYQSWTGSFPNFCPSCADAVTARGGAPLITWEPWVTATSIKDGTHDAHLRSYLTNVATWGKPILLRPMHEMNLKAYPWGISQSPAADLKAAFQHIVAIGDSVGATNVRWVWSPNVGQSLVTYAEIYPGDDYVDWLGLDGYNWGTTQTWSSWKSFYDVMKPSYDAITALSSRPLMVGETASTEQGGDKAAWISGVTADLVLLPRIQAWVWFNQNKETDWRVNSTAAALDAYRAFAAGPLVRGALTLTGTSLRLSPAATFGP